MVIGLIFTLALLVFMAFFIGKNLDYSCSLWFFKTFENKPVYMLVLVAFAAGIAAAILCIIIVKITKSLKSDNAESITREEMGKKIHKNRSLLKKAEKINSDEKSSADSGE